MTSDDGGGFPARRLVNPETAVGVGDIGEHKYQADDLNLTRSEQRSWLVHRQLAEHLTAMALTEWRPAILDNIARLREGVRGQPHLRNLDRWQRNVESGDLEALRQALTGQSRHDIEMREVSPTGGLLPDNERREALGHTD
ncbi:hypothetical protein [Mycolicibacterium llatzerense]|uniref:hypothetical protein n=1 Tax=Mycolicibacterium llatzerense TaxID=280871 RepID=UPI0008DE85B6|nr:hypothetical protein [Mycolicibacterium llatzerense]